ncbi:MAG: hypothetical protein A2Y15_01760 [Clostridiales bacterium GWF2_36_10]|nr:MAG: hypothetical protein A2Y15_01760 [Clostridiales bacterium GWF2_36_10]
MHIIKRIVIILAVLSLVGIIVIASLNFYVIGKAKDYIITKEEAKELDDVDCIIVLGALVYGDGKLSDILEHRVEKAITLYEMGVSDRILMSGDHGRESYNEVQAMKDFAVEEGVDKECIHMDHAGFSTYDSMYRVKEVFQAKKVIIVTQKFHMSRAIYLARALGLEAYGVTCDIGTYLGENYNNIRESAARVKAVYSAVFKPKPSYLGDVIPISGKGSLTDDRY